MDTDITIWIHYNAAVSDALRRRGFVFDADWFDSLTTPSGEHRSHLHKRLGLSVAESARELAPFADAQLNHPIQSEDWKNCCSEWIK